MLNIIKPYFDQLKRLENEDSNTLSFINLHCKKKSSTNLSLTYTGFYIELHKTKEWCFFQVMKSTKLARIIKFDIKYFSEYEQIYHGKYFASCVLFYIYFCRYPRKISFEETTRIVNSILANGKQFYLYGRCFCPSMKIQCQVQQTKLTKIQTPT